MQEKTIVSSLNQTQIDTLVEVIKAYTAYKESIKTRLGSSSSITREEYREKAAQFLEPYERAFSNMNDEYAKNRAHAAIDWASFFMDNTCNMDDPNIKYLLFFRLAYDMQHATPLAPDFITRLAEKTADFLRYGDNRNFVATRLYIIMLATALVASAILALALAGIVAVNPLFTAIYLINCVIAGIAILFINKLHDFYMNYSVFEKFNPFYSDSDDSIFGKRVQAFIFSDYNSLISQPNTPHNDRHLRPYDKLGFFNTHEKVDKFRAFIESEYEYKGGRSTF